MKQMFFQPFLFVTVLYHSVCSSSGFYLRSAPVPSYRLLDDFLKEWQLRKRQLREGEITKEEYLEWKLNWPQTADGCGRYEPKKKWRKE